MKYLRVFLCLSVVAILYVGYGAMGAIFNPHSGASHIGNSVFNSSEYNCSICGKEFHEPRLYTDYKAN